MISPASGLRCRQIAEADIPAVSALLAHGFHKRSIQFWERALDRLGKREPPPSLPKYGYHIERNSIPVGALLIICATLRTGSETVGMLSPNFASRQTLLVSMALRRKDVT